MKFNVIILKNEWFPYGGEPQNVCNFVFGLNVFAKPKSRMKIKSVDVLLSSQIN